MTTFLSFSPPFSISGVSRLVHLSRDHQNQVEGKEKPPSIATTGRQGGCHNKTHHCLSILICLHALRLPGNRLGLWVAAEQGQTLRLQNLESVTRRSRLQRPIHAEHYLQTHNREMGKETMRITGIIYFDTIPY